MFSAKMEKKWKEIHATIDVLATPAIEQRFPIILK